MNRSQDREPVFTLSPLGSTAARGRSGARSVFRSEKMGKVGGELGGPVSYQCMGNARVLHGHRLGSAGGENLPLNLRVRDWLIPDAVMAWSSAHFGDD